MAGVLGGVLTLGVKPFGHDALGGWAFLLVLFFETTQLGVCLR